MRSSTISSSSMLIFRLHRAARFSSWVMSTSVISVSFCNPRSRSIMYAAETLSRLPVGSSASNKSGALIMARSIALRLFPHVRDQCLDVAISPL